MFSSVYESTSTSQSLPPNCTIFFSSGDEESGALLQEGTMPRSIPQLAR